MLIRANTLAFGLIGKDGPHGIIKICFGIMNLVFVREVALLGFWEYMLRILFRVSNKKWPGRFLVLIRVHWLKYISGLFKIPGAL